MCIDNSSLREDKTMKKLFRNVSEARKTTANSDLHLNRHVQLDYMDPVYLTENCFLAFALADSEGELPVCIEGENINKRA